MIVLILPILWLVLILVGIKFNKTPLAEAPLSKDQTLAIRGICAIEIILGHLSIYTGSSVLYPLRKADILFVGLFFLISGYGTAFSFEKKDGYKKLFVIKKMLRLFIPAYMAYAVNKVHLYILYPNICHFQDLLRPLVFLQDINWFIYELMAMYILAYVCEKLGGLKKSHFIIWILAILFLISACIYAFDDPWYGCTLCFPLGVTYYHYKDKIDKVLFRSKPLLSGLGIIVLFLSFTAGYMLLNDRLVIVGILSRNLASVAFCLLAMLVLTYVTVANRLSTWLGKISFELYLYHIPVIGMAVFYIDNILLAGIVVLVGSVVLAFVMKIVWQILFGPISQVKKIENVVNNK